MVCIQGLDSKSRTQSRQIAGEISVDALRKSVLTVESKKTKLQKKCTSSRKIKTVWKNLCKKSINFHWWVNQIM